MTAVLTVLLALLVFGLLILVHELGHYTFARIFDVHIHEFSIGMGPKLWQKVSKKTGIAYSLRALPIGGFVQMAGEDEECDDPRALNRKPVWQRMIIVAAGGVVNIVIGFVLTFVMVASMQGLGGTTIAEFGDSSTSSDYLREGDRIIAIEGHRVYSHMDVAYEIMRLGIDPVSVTLERDGERTTVDGVVFPVQISDGIKLGDMDFKVYAVDKNIGSVLGQSAAYCRLTVKQVWESIFDLIRGRYSVKAVSGPVGTVTEIGEAAQVSIANKNPTSFLYIIILIAVNLGVLNLLPIPALDGGRLVFMLIELIFRKRVPPEIEGKIHLAGLLAFFVLMILITFKDIFSFF